jgi:hypothetical protein
MLGGWCSCACVITEGCKVAFILGYIDIYKGVDKRDDRCKVIVMARRKQEKRWS